MVFYGGLKTCLFFKLFTGLVFLLTTDCATIPNPDDWSSYPEFPDPLITNCKEKDIDLILISDASSPEYGDQLHLLVQVVDMFASTQDNPERLRVAMAVSGSDDQGRPSVAWLFQFGASWNASQIKRAIIEDQSRNTSSMSNLKEAVQFVRDSLSKAEVSTEKPVSVHTSSPTQVPWRNRTDSLICIDNDDDDDSINAKDFNSTKKDNIKPSRGDRITLIIALGNANQFYLRDYLPDSKNHHEHEKLFIVFIHQLNFVIRNTIPCNRLVSIPCVDVELDSMLQDHSLSIALCGRCLSGWFGPMPMPTMVAEEKGKRKQFSSILAFRSCYKIAPFEIRGTYALREMEKCEHQGGSLVSIESEIELNFLNTALTQWCVSNTVCLELHHIVFIGLRRNTDSLGKRFRWMNGRPLLYHMWEPFLPIGGTVHGCALWNLNNNQWVDMGCGQKMNPSAELCEWTKRVSPENLKLEAPPTPTESSIEKAINRGELCLQQFFQGDIKPVLLSSQYWSQLPDCSLYINKTGRLTILNSPLDLSPDRAFPCEDDFQTLLQYHRVCNEVQDCPNAKDESLEVCSVPHHLVHDVFTCTTSEITVPAEARCDLFVDCPDKSDEQDCKTCQFGLCSDGRCVPQPWLIDGQKDCLSLYNALELDMEIATNIEKDCAFLCNRSVCVPWDKLGDGVIDCRGPEGPLDETLGALERADCNDTYSHEWAPRCIYQKDRLGEVIGCRNMRHLHGCQNFVCPEGYMKCPNTYCIPVHYLFNKAIDCPFGEDEQNQVMGWHALQGYFKCDYTVNSVMVHPDRVCDGSSECPGGSDEAECHVTCAKGFLCALGFVVADDYDKSKPLTSLGFVDPRTRMIDFSNINLSTVLLTIVEQDMDFLIDLRLSNCSLTNTHVPWEHYAFPRLSKLDLSYNLLQTINTQNEEFTDIFSGLRALTLLNLSHNALLTLFDSYALLDTPRLVTLDLSHTALTHFPQMDHISRELKYLNLSYTRITQLTAFLFLSKNSYRFLASLDLRGVKIKDVERYAFKGLMLTSELHSDYFKLCCPQIREDGIPAHVCHAPLDPFSSCSNLLENDLLRYLVWVMGVASLLGNLAVIGTRLAAWNTTQQQPYAQLVTQLGISDFLMGVYLIIIASKDVEYSGEYVWHDTSWPHSALCHAAGFLSTVSSEVSSCFILFITVDRYLVIRFPFGQHRLTGRGVLICSISAWSVGFVLAAIPLLPWMEHWEIYSSNAVCLGLPLIPERRAGWQFSVTVFIAFNSLLCLCIAVGQLAIYNVASSTRRAAPVLSLTDLRASGSTRDLTPRMKQDVALARRLATVAFTDLICWMPIGVLGFMAVGGHSLGSEAYAWMAVFVLPVNSALNPILYSLPALKNRVVKAFTNWVSSIKRRRTSDE